MGVVGSRYWWLSLAIVAVMLMASISRLHRKRSVFDQLRRLSIKRLVETRRRINAIAEHWAEWLIARLYSS